MKNFSVFKNYKSGEIASRLYIKNLAKQTTEQVDITCAYSFCSVDELPYMYNILFKGTD